MTAPSPEKQKNKLIAEVGADKVAALVEKYDEDAIAALFAFHADDSTLSLADVYEHTLRHYCGTWEDLAEYLATNLQPKIDEALKEYSEKHRFNWQIKIDDLTQMNWGDISDYADENYYYVLPTHFDDLDRANFVFEVPPYE